MKRKILTWGGIILLVGILGYFLGAAIVILALMCFGIGYWIAKRRGGTKNKDTVIRLRR